MEFWGWFKSSQKRFEEAADVEINIFRKNSQLLRDELNMIEGLNSQIVNFKKAETGIDGKKELEKFRSLVSSFFKIISDIEKVYEKDRKLLLSAEYLQQPVYKSKVRESIEENTIKQKVILMNRLIASSINLVDEIADFLALNERIPDAEINSIRESLAKILRDLFEATGDLFTHHRFDPQTLQRARTAYQNYIGEFGVEYKKAHEKQERRVA